MISSIPSTNTNIGTLTPYALLGHQPVGLESAELKTSSFKSLEEPAGSAASENRRSSEDRPNEQGEKLRVTRARSEQIPKVHGESAANQKLRLERKRKQMDKFVAFDWAVRAPKQTHAAVAGQYTGTATYSFVRKPDGVSYAVGSNVSINTSPIPSDPQATIRKAQQIRMAASAPVNSSSQDRQVTAHVTSENKAGAELTAYNASEVQQIRQKSQATLRSQMFEAKQQATNEDELNSAIKHEKGKRQLTLNPSSEEGTVINKSPITLDINRRLVEAGAVKGAPSLGNLFNINV